MLDRLTQRWNYLNTFFVWFLSYALIFTNFLAKSNDHIFNWRESKIKYKKLTLGILYLSQTHISSAS